jgi:uncharacterized protein
VIVPDINLLVYAIDSTSPFHQPAHQWWTAALHGGELIGIPTIVALGVIRLISSPRVVQNPLPPAQAAALIDTWLQAQTVSILECGANHFSVVTRLLAETAGSSNLVNDAHIAALAIEHRAVVYSNDVDFARFRDLKWKNPLN